MKKMILFLSTVVLVACSDTTQNAAEQMLQQANQQFEQGQYDRALITIDSLRKVYPGAIDTRKRALTQVGSVPVCIMKRNPRVYRGRFITVTRREDGSLKPNFRPLPTDADLSVEKYALGVANELMWALEGLGREK